jgi:hypothetical protein
MRKRPTKWTFTCRKIDLIRDTHTRINEAKGNFIRETQQARDSSTGLAFVVCKTSAERDRILREFKGGDDECKSRRWKLYRGVHPSEINWENLDKPRTLTGIVRVFMDIAFILLFLVFITPTLFLQFIGDILTDLNMNAFLEGFLSQYITALLLLIYQSVIIPFFINTMVTLENHEVKSKQIISAYKKFTIYNIFYLFLLPAVGIAFMDLIVGLITGDKAVQRGLALGITRSGQLLLNFMIHQVFISLPLGLLNIGRLISVKLNAKKALNQYERVRAYEYGEYFWPYEYATIMTIFVILLCMSVVYPLILAIGMLYFTIRVRGM